MLGRKSLLSNSNGVYIIFRIFTHNTFFFRVIDIGAQIPGPIGAKICVGLRQRYTEMRRLL